MNRKLTARSATHPFLPMESKTELRQRMRQGLREVPAEANEALISVLKHHAASWQPRSTVAIYGGLRGEPDLVGGFLPWLRENGHKAVLFAIEGENLAPLLVCEPADLIRSRLGAWEPNESCASLPVAGLDVIIVPGLAFSPRHLTRLGRGGGYYDRLLAQPECHARRIALAHSFQIIDELPVEPHDQKVHEILTSGS